MSEGYPSSNRRAEDLAPPPKRPGVGSRIVNWFDTQEAKRLDERIAELEEELAYLRQQRREKWRKAGA